jgi:Protein of Unknown function (DUF2784)
VPYQLLADLVLLLHACIVAFVVLGLFLIIIGNLLRWRYINAIWFRAAHLLAIAIVVGESWFGITCPLTTWEVALRTEAGQETYGAGFVEHWVGRLLFYDAPPWVFTMVYTAFGMLVVLTWLKYPPRCSSANQKPSDT